MLEKLFENALWKSRFIVILAVIFGFMGAVILFIVASIDIIDVAKFIITTFIDGSHPEHFHEDIVAGIIGAVDLYLIAVVMLIFSFKLDETEIKAFPHQIALNVIPQIDVAQDNGFTKEEMKMVKETQKIMHKKMQIAATCVRVPVLRSHSESLTVTFEDGVDADLEKVREALSNFENVEVLDDLANKKYPMPIISTDTDITYVGRIRKDIYAPNIIHYFNVADQVRVGAATNAVRIALKWADLENDI